MPLSPGAVAERFAPAGLDELRGASDLQDREERKYVVPAATFAALAAELLGTHVVLEIGGLRAFDYRTTYLDTPELLTYREHLQGRRRRFKCRTRDYADTGLRAFEVKLKGLRGRTVKRRLEGDADELAAAGFLRACLLDAYGRVVTEPFAPVLAVRHTRVTLAAPALGERLTCDSLVRFGTAGALRDGTVILESKYCVGVALTRPGVPANSLRPLLRRHFGVVAT